MCGPRRRTHKPLSENYSQMRIKSDQRKQRRERQKYIILADSVFIVTPIDLKYPFRSHHACGRVRGPVVRWVGPSDVGGMFLDARG
jgi:hypothetical protein